MGAWRNETRDEPGRLIVRLRFEPGELLSSFVMRLAQRNGVSHYHLLRHLGCPHEPILGRLDIRASEKLFSALSARTLAKDKDLRASRFVDIPNRNVYWNWLLGHGSEGARDRSRDDPGWLQFCPRCLASDRNPFFRRRWRIALSTACTTHGCLLLDRCPHCHRPVDMASPEMSCCGRPYADAPSIPASPLGIVVQHCLDLVITGNPRLIAPSLENEAMAQLAATLMSRLPPNAGLRFVDLFPVERHVLTPTLVGPPPSPPTGYFSLHQDWMRTEGEALLQASRTARQIATSRNLVTTTGARYRREIPAVVFKGGRKPPAKDEECPTQVGAAFDWLWCGLL